MKRLIATVLSAVLLLSAFAGCGKSDNGNGVKNGKTGTGNSEDFSVETAVMPTRELKNKKITYLCWQELDEIYASGYPIHTLMNEEFGVEFTPVLASHESYWDTLATLIAAGNSPDVVYLPNWNYYPLAITQDMLQPLDDYIDFSDPMWDDTKTEREAHKWNGKTYIPFFDKTLSNLLFYNKTMFKNYGVKTPRELYEEDNWTWQAMSETANKFVHKTSAGIVDVYGLGFMRSPYFSSTGVELVTMENDTYKFNMKDAKFATVMNQLYDLGQGGSGTLAGSNGMELFKSGRLAMYSTVANAAVGELHDMLEAGKLDWVPLPKLDNNSKYYNEICYTPGWGICSGAKNPEAGALLIEFCKWCSLGKSFFLAIPNEDNAASIKYEDKLEGANDPYYFTSLFAESEVEWSKKLAELPEVSTDWQSWLGTTSFEGYNYIWSGTKKWSAVVEEYYPMDEAILKSYFN